MMQGRIPTILLSNLNLFLCTVCRMDANTPSIRSSGNRGRSNFRAIPIEKALLDTAKQFLESYQFDLRIRQHLHEDKLDTIIAKQTFYLLGNTHKYEPGYILVMKGHPVIFLNARFQFGFALRLRLHSSLYTNQAIFIGTLDTIHASLRLEDVLLYDGVAMNREPFEKRYETLHSFFHNAFVQDERLSGITVSLTELHPLSHLKQLVDSALYYSIDFVPAQANRRRFYLTLPQPQTVFQTPKKPVPEPVKEPVTPQLPTIPKEERTSAMAFKIKGMPDTYELKDETGNSLGKAAVQTSEVSQLLRQAIQAEGKKVKIQWYEEFERFKIIDLLN